MEGALVNPSEEDCQTFCINFRNGEVFKMRAAETRERQAWVDQLRASSSRTGRGPGSGRSWRSWRARSTSSLCEQFLKPLTNKSDIFASVEDILHVLDEKQHEVAKAIESLPLLKNAIIVPDQHSISNPSCHSKHLLLLKATSTATLQCLETALSMLQDISCNIQAPVSGTPSRLHSPSGSIKIKNTGN